MYKSKKELSNLSNKEIIEELEKAYFNLTNRHTQKVCNYIEDVKQEILIRLNK